MKRILVDLFAGLGGASEAFVQHPDWKVFRIDNSPLVESVDCMIQCDMIEFDCRNLGIEKIDVIWASPPCTEFSTARVPQIQNPDLTLIKRTIEIIEATNPRAWIIENVRGAIKHFLPLLGPPRLILGPYCFWGNFPLFWVEMEGHSKLKDDPWSTDPLRAHKRAYVPIEISRAFLESLKNQTTLDRWF